MLTKTKLISTKDINQTAELDGLTVCYDDLGKDGIPIVFIHGFPFDKSTWLPQMEFLKHTHRVIAYDIRGFGKTVEHKSKKHSISVYSDDLMDFLDVLDINKVIICGLSMGGYIALNAAQRYPERIEALILSDTQCIADSEENKAKRDATIMQLEAGELEVFSDKFLGSLFSSETLHSKMEIHDKIEVIILRNSIEALTNGLKALRDRENSCSTLDAISVPTLILCGREDQLTPVEQSDFLNENIRDSKFKIIEKAGHLPNLEQAIIFNNLLFSFISNLRI